MNALKTTLLLAACGLLTSCSDQQADVADDTSARESGTQTTGHNLPQRHGQNRPVAQNSRQNHAEANRSAQPHHGDHSGGTGHESHAAGEHQGKKPHGKHSQHHAGAVHRNQPTKQAHGQHTQRKADTSHGKSGHEHQTAIAEKSDTDPLAIFNRRILPIMQSSRSSSCTECHLSGVAIKDFILADQSKTFASLRQRGLIDVKAPDNSKILKFIARKPAKPNPISEKVRKQELAAFRAWIRAAVKDPQLLKAAAGKDVVGLKLPPEVIRHARKDRVMGSFVDNVWSQMGRCINCHSPDRNKRVVRKNGEQVSWIVPRNPAATLKKLVDGDNIDLKNPEKSPVLQKPAGLMDHGGGPKFRVGGPTYRNMLGFLKDYAATVNGQYRSTDDLPKPNPEVAYLTQQHLRIIRIPAGLDKTPLQVVLFRWNEEEKRWSKDRWGTAFNPINGKRHMWQSMISATASTSSKRAETIRRRHERLPEGRYLVKIYVDKERKTAKNPDYRLGKQEFVGQVEIRGRWKAGYQPPKIIRFPVTGSKRD